MNRDYYFVAKYSDLLEDVINTGLKIDIDNSELSYDYQIALGKLIDGFEAIKNIQKELFKEVK